MTTPLVAAGPQVVILTGVSGSGKSTALRALEQLYGLVAEGYPLFRADVDHAVRLLKANRKVRLKDIFLDAVYVASDRRIISPKSAAQKTYLDTIRSYDIVASGPDVELVGKADGGEDVIHPLSLKLNNAFIPEYDMVQMPVFPLHSSHANLVHWTYADEFAEYHTKDLMVRQHFSGFVPSAGVGTAFNRWLIEFVGTSYAKNIFRSKSLTEDYDLALRLALGKANLLFTYKPFGINVATRGYFPHTMRTSIKQKSRWITGICLQSWRNVGWKGDARFKFVLYRDRKAVISNAINFFAYVVILYLICYEAVRFGFAAYRQLPPIVVKGTLLWDLVVIDEAHRLRNVYKPSNVIANTLKLALQERPKLLLTATPLQNSLLAHRFDIEVVPDLDELFELADEDDLQEFRIVRLQVGEQPNLFEQFVGQVLRLVNDEHRFAIFFSQLEQEEIQHGKRFKSVQPCDIQAELRRDGLHLLGAEPARAAAMQFKPFQAEALEILIAWGEKRNEAMELIELAAQKHPDAQTAEELVTKYINAVGGAGAISAVKARSPKRGLVVLFTDLVDSISSRDAVANLSRLARTHLPVVVILDDPQIVHLAEAPATESIDAFIKASAEQFISEKRRTLTMLRTRGCLIVNVTADKLNASVVNQYLAVKARNLL